MSAARSVCFPSPPPPTLLPLLTRFQVAAKHFQGALQRWPKDVLRPECQLQDVLAKRLAQGSLAPVTRGATQEQADLKQANALYSLLEDRFKTKVGDI
jgi:cytochrome b pre-mRNA-processing protein 6